MKKLILLAVVILGFAATSFAQTANAGVNGQIQLPAAVAPLTVSWLQDMDFGIITNKATTTGVAGINTAGNGYMILAPNGGGAAPTPTISNITYTGTLKVAKFAVRNVTVNGPLQDGDITLTNYSDHLLAGGNAWFDTSSAGTTNNSYCSQNFTVIEHVSGSTTADSTERTCAIGYGCNQTPKKIR
jgi:hypothetical protein